MKGAAPPILSLGFSSIKYITFVHGFASTPDTAEYVESSCQQIAHP